MDAESIKQVAAMYGSPVDPRRNDLHINCPFGAFHSKGVDTSQGLSVRINPSKQSPCYCFSCGTSGTLSYVFEKAAELDPFFKEVHAFILERDGPSLSGALARLSDGEVVAQEAPLTDWAAYSARCARQVPAYLVERGVVAQDVRRWMLGYDSYLVRAIFPVRDEHGAVIGCLRRAIHESQNPRYKDTPGAYTWKKLVFYGEHRIDKTRSTAYVVEGPMGTIFASRLFPNVLGMMGSNTGIEGPRLEKLHRWGITNLILMLDSDKAGNEAVYGKVTPKGEVIQGLRDRLRREFVVKVAKLPVGEDPDDVVRRDPTALKRIVDAASYLEPSRLTGAPSPASLGVPNAGKQRSVIDYLRHRSKR